MPNYKSISFFYDLIDVFYFNHKSRSPRTALLSAIQDKPVRVLDVCAGTCSNSIMIAENKPQTKITALDLSVDMLKIAENKFCKRGLDNIEVFVGNACDSGLPDESFDVILVSLVLHEIDEDMRNGILLEAKRLLCSNGQIIIIEWEQPANIFQRSMFALIKLLEPKGFKEFLSRDLTGYFTEMGFAVVETMSCDYTKLIKLHTQ
jgi:demethylmenaquinone methyltransferase/2-methoxy-6-polyprenyl-1,4-benzoquinol methylase